MRVQFVCRRLARRLADLERGFSWVAEAFHIAGNSRPARGSALIMVSRLGHCLNDLLFRWKRAGSGGCGRLVSSHDDFGELAAAYRISFRHIPVTPETKAAAESQLLDVSTAPART